MASIIDTLFRVEDAAGDPIPLGKVRVYLVGTTTLADLFTTADLNPATPLTNPVVADTGGWAAQIFAASATYRVDTLTAADVLVKTQTTVPSLGTSSTGLDLTLPNGTRYKVTDSGGRVLVQVGDPDPDNTGGKLTIEGWAGSQADDILLDAALIDTTGRIKEIGKKSIGFIYTDATTFSSSAGVAITLPNDPTGVRQWEVEIWDLQCAGVTALTCQLSYDGGGTYKSGAGDYWYTKWIADNTAGPGAVYAVSAGDTKLDLVYAVRTAANKSGRLTVRITTPNSGSEHTLVESDGLCLDRTAATSVAAFGMKGVGLGGFGRVTHLKILQGANAISGSYRVKPLRGSGET